MVSLCWLLLILRIALGQYRGFTTHLTYDPLSKEFKVKLKHALQYTVSLGEDVFGNIQRIDNLLHSLDARLHDCKAQLENTKIQLANAKEEVKKPFAQEEELKTKSARLDELNILLNMDKRENEIVEGEAEEAAISVRDNSDRVR